MSPAKLARVLLLLSLAVLGGRAVGQFQVVTGGQVVGTIYLAYPTGQDEATFHLIRVDPGKPKKDQSGKLQTPQRPADLIVDLTLARVDLGPAAAEPATIKLHVGKKKGLILEGVVATGRYLSVGIVATELTPGVEYTRRFSVKVADQTPQIWTVKLKRATLPRPVLLLDRSDYAKNIMCKPLQFSGDAPKFEVRLTEKENREIRDIRTRLDGATSSPDGSFDLGRHVVFEFRSNQNPAPSATAPADGEDKVILGTVPAGSPAIVAMRATELGAGEHKFTLRFSGVRTEAEREPKLAVHFKVRHHWIWAVVVLLFAMVLSYYTLKGAVNWRTRIQLMERISKLRQTWLWSLPATRPVISLRAWLRQSLQVVEGGQPNDQPMGWTRRILEPGAKGIAGLTGWRRLIPAPQKIKSRLDRADQLIAVLRDYDDLRRSLGETALPHMVRYRIDLALGSFLKSLDLESISDQTAQHHRDTLRQLRGWLEQPAQLYRARIASDIEGLRADIGLRGIDADADLKMLNDELTAKMTEPSWATAGLGDLAEADKLYSRMRILHEWRDDPHLNEVRNLALELDNPVEELFRVTDTIIWGRIKQEVDKTPGDGNTAATSAGDGEQGGKPSTQGHAGTSAQNSRVWIVPNNEAKTLEPVEAYRPLCFSLKFADDELGQKYIVQHAVRYEWHFKSADKTEWTAESVGPQIVQYAPVSGTLEIGVTLRYRSESVTVKTAKLDFGPTTEFKTTQSFERNELVSLGIAFVVALVSGIASQYTDTFGSFKDYLLLFLWGVGVDQGKNLISMLKSP